MLHKSFKPAKCKTSLKMASSRTKLLKNKKEVQVKQLRRELAQLLESGQEQTAIIRVEHVVREEKMMTAYELIEIFCELIHARMQIIESQKNCPIDMKEAVASVVFASPRCSDIPELVDVRKHFTAKYGKEFVSAAVELRPACGVNRNLVDKLSAKSPDGQTKLKILTAIAEEHNIKWDSKSFGEKATDHQEDLLNGPNSFQNSSQMHVQPSNVQSSYYYDRGPPNVQISPQSEVKQEPSVNAQASNIRTSYGSQNDAPVRVNVYANPHPDLNSSGAERQGMGHTHRHSASMGGRQNWNMEFKDATSAAQAAAESAEMASIAARAAAQLSSMERITTQNSSQSQVYSFQHSTHEFPRRHPTSSVDGSNEASFQDSRPSTYQESQGSSSHHSTHELPRKHYGPNSDVSSTKGSFKDSRPSASAKASTNSAFHGDFLIDDDEPEDLATVMRRLSGNVNSSRPSTALKSNADSFAKVPSPGRPEPQPQAARKNARRNSFDESSAVRHSRKFEHESSNKFDLEEARFEEAVDRVSSYAHSSVTSRDRRDALKGVEDFHEDHKAKNDTADVVFDNYDEGESYGFDLDKEWSSPRSKVNPSPFSSVFTKTKDDSAVQPQLDELPPIVFDDVSGPHSESEEEPERSTPRRVLSFGLTRNYSNTSEKSMGRRIQNQNQNQPLYSSKMQFFDERNDRTTEISDPDESLVDVDNAFYLGNLPGGRRNKTSRIFSSARNRYSPPPKTSDGENDSEDEVKKKPKSPSPYRSFNSRSSSDRPKLESEIGKRSTSRASGLSRRTKGSPPSDLKSYFGFEDSEESPPKRNSFSNRSSDSKSKLAYDDEPTRRRINTKSSLQSSSSSPRRSSNLNSTFYHEDAEEIEELSPEVKPSRKTSIPDRNSKHMEAQERRSYAEGSSSSLKPRTASVDDSRNQERYEDRKPSSSRISPNPTRTSGNVQSGNEFSDSRRGYDSRSSLSDKNSNLKFKPGSDEAGRYQEHRFMAGNIASEKVDPESVRKTSIPDRNSKHVEAQERPSYAEGSSSSLKPRTVSVDASRNQERYEDRKPSSSSRNPTRTSGSVQSGTEFSDSRSGYDSRSSLSDKNSNLKIKPGNEEAVRSQEHRADRFMAVNPESPKAPLPKDMSETASSESLKTLRVNSLNNKASHVHPKLPDCDSFAAHFEALRAKRQ